MLKESGISNVIYCPFLYKENPVFDTGKVFHYCNECSKDTSCFLR